MSIIDVERAATTLDGVVVRTPVLSNAELDERVGARVVLKAECLQRGGSFKLRGAYNAISSIPEADRRDGIVAVSSGNHAIAVALSASLLGTRASILVPHDAPAVKIDVVRALGAEVVTFDRYRDDRDERTRAFVTERGLPFVPPFDHPDVIAGQGTVALELVQDRPDLDTLVVPVSGGGLVAGCGLAAPSARIIGVEPESMDDTRRSLEAGERVSVAATATIADGLTVTAPGELTWPINRGRLSEVATVTDDEIVDAMRFLFRALHLVVEPSGAVGVAALLTGKADVRDRTVGVVLSGGNVALERFVELVSAS